MASVRLTGRRSNGIRVDLEVWRIIRQGDEARDRFDWAGAASFYTMALQIDPRLGHVAVQLGHARKEAGDFAGALTAYEAAARLLPSDSEPCALMAELLERRGSFVAAAMALAEALVLSGGGEASLGQRLQRVVGLAANEDPTIARTLMRPIADRLRRSTGSVASAIVAIVKELAAADRCFVKTGDQPSTDGIVYDISDLISYFSLARQPTGIQRVQLEIVGAALLDAPTSVDLCCFVPGRNDWLTVAVGDFQRVMKLSTAQGSVDDADWLESVTRLHWRSMLTPAFRFGHGDRLINLGTSWWLQNYFLQVRRAKAEYGICYIPFVHDLIPVEAPHHCVDGLTRDFLSWTSGVFFHADSFLTNSRATRDDLLRFAAASGRTIQQDEVVVVPLDADFTSGAVDDALPASVSEPFVLFVATIESRKGHVVALTAWQKLIARLGSRTPLLVCVGNSGWLNEEVYRTLDQDAVLAERVRMLSRLPDRTLRTLYQRCMFTIYPSLYEGWGLPITESLCHGKVPVTTTSTSLPEAGGPWAVYVAPGSAEELADAVERLTCDQEERMRRERRIALEFRPRTWREIAGQITAATGSIKSLAVASPPFEMPLGRRLTFARVMATRVDDLEHSAERFREGGGWHAPEPWGCAVREAATLLFASPADKRPMRVSVWLCGLSDTRIRWTLRAGDVELVGVTIGQGEHRCGSGVLPPSGQSPVRLVLTAVMEGGAPTSEQPPSAAIVGIEAILVEEE